MKVLKQQAFAPMRVAMLLMLVVVLLSSLPVRADDLAPPPWRLGSPSSTWQHWQFSNPPAWPAGPPGAEYPENWVNPNGLPQENVAARINAAWHNMWGGRQGVWELQPFGQLQWRCPNFGLPIPKLVRFQVTLSIQNISWSGPVTNVGPVTQLETDPVSGITWYHHWADYRFPTCNPFNFSVLSGSEPFGIDQLVIDTVCVPEPGSMLLSTIGFGVVGAAMRRRRKA